MKKKDENKLVKLLKKLYGNDWSFTWDSQDHGFNLNLQVWKGEKYNDKR